MFGCYFNIAEKKKKKQNKILQRSRIRIVAMGSEISNSILQALQKGIKEVPLVEGKRLVNLYCLILALDNLIGVF